MDPIDLKPGQEIKGWIVKKLCSKHETDRDAAKQFLDTLGGGGVDLMLDIVQEESRKRCKQRRYLYWGLGIYFGIIALFLLNWIGQGLFTGTWSHFPKGIFQLFSTMGCFGAAAAASTIQKTGTQWLAQHPDPRMIGPLLDGIGTNDKPTKEAAESALVALLPALEPQHAGLLTSQHRNILHDQLKSRNRAFSDAILNALPVLADTSAIQSVEALIHRLERERRPDPVRITAAKETLAGLEELNARSRERETLLRPAEDGPVDNLLRPAVSLEGTNVSLLVRPVD